MKLTRKGNHEFNNSERRDYHKERTNKEVIDGILARVESGEVFTSRPGDDEILREMEESGYVEIHGKDEEGRIIFQKNDRPPYMYGDDIDLTVKVMTSEDTRVFRRDMDALVAGALVELGHAEKTDLPDGVRVKISRELTEKDLAEVREHVNAAMGHQASAVA